MDSYEKLRKRLRLDDTRTQNEYRRITGSAKHMLYSLLRLIIIIGISYIILGPMIGIAFSSFFSNADQYSPIVYLIPMEPTLERYRLALFRLDYWDVMRNLLIYVLSLMVIQVAVCSMVGYGFARFNFPLKKLFFGCVVVMIIVPLHSIMLPLYMTFQDFNPLGLVGLFNGGKGVNLLTKPTPVYIMTLLAGGLRSGLYIYIFNQFFRGLPKEIEEAALVDGAGFLYTYVKIMLPNATPSIVTVSIFSMVWQYNDTFFANLFSVSPDIVISKRLVTLQATIANNDRIMDPSIQTLYVYAGIVMLIIPILLMYVFLQKRFIEGVERSGIVG